MSSPKDDHPESEVTDPTVNVAEYKKLIVFLPDGTANVFKPDGTTDDYAEIKLEISGIPSLIVNLRGLTGVVTSHRENQ